MRIFILLFCIGISFCLFHLGFRSKPLRRPVIIAHRGAGGLAPENTLAGMQAAFDHQSALVEVDVRRSQDGVLLLLHDRTVDRTTNGQGAVHTLAWEAVQQLDAGSHFAAAFAGEPIPALDAVLAFVQHTPIILVIELKDTALYPGIEQEVVAAIKRYALQEHVIVVSFQPTSLQTLHPLLPDVPQGLLTIYPTNRALHNYQKSGDTKRVSVYWLSVMVDPTLVQRLHKDGYIVWVWTVNQPWVMRLLFWLGVDGITTDRPDLALEVLSEY